MDTTRRELIRTEILAHRHLFQEYTDLSGIDPERHSRLIIERLLDHGDLDSIHRVFDAYGRDRVLTDLKRSRNASSRTKHFFELVYG